jgi:hypothetical protein
MIESHRPYFIQRRDNAGRLGLFSLQKMTTALRKLAYKVTGDLIDEHLRTG